VVKAVQEVSRWSLTAEARVRARLIVWDFLVDKVALGQVFLPVLRVSPVTIIPPWLSILMQGDQNSITIFKGIIVDTIWSRTFFRVFNFPE
jgi:hypothetical protein